MYCSLSILSHQIESLVGICFGVRQTSSSAWCWSKCCQIQKNNNNSWVFVKQRLWIFQYCWDYPVEPSNNSQQPLKIGISCRLLPGTKRGLIARQEDWDMKRHMNDQSLFECCCCSVVLLLCIWSWFLFSLVDVTTFLKSILDKKIKKESKKQ